MPGIKLDNVSLTLGKNKILDKLTLEIDSGEYFSLVGETGAGKTSILNLVSGLIRPTSGRILIGEKDVTKVLAEDRDIGMVFEDYALFPHYDVLKNVTYSHRVHDKDPGETRKAAREILNLMLLYKRDDALPVELSGGMQQRVALARSLMTNLGILLLDDPLSALDAGLRMSLRIELKNLAKELGTTVIHCTNDIEEAMIVGTRMAIIKDGKIEQLGTPNDIYFKPENLYVFEFLGDVNLLRCKIDEVDMEREYYFLTYETKDSFRKFRTKIKQPPYFKAGDEVILGVRAEHFSIRAGYRKKPNRIKGIIEEISFLGHRIRYEIADEFGETRTVQRFMSERTKHMRFQVGEAVTIYYRSTFGYLFPIPINEDKTKI
ncbi:MAG: ABC transporter ATP-binding protein [Candidatus Hodarchaeota archaeon]